MARYRSLDNSDHDMYANLYNMNGGATMNTLTYTTARAKLAETMKQVCENHEPVIITRQKEEPVVMLSLDDFNSMEETAYLLRSPENARRLLESLAEVARGGGVERELSE